MKSAVQENLVLLEFPAGLVPLELLDPVAQLDPKVTLALGVTRAMLVIPAELVCLVAQERLDHKVLQAVMALLDPSVPRVLLVFLVLVERRVTRVTLDLVVPLDLRVLLVAQVLTAKLASLVEMDNKDRREIPVSTDNQAAMVSPEPKAKRVMMAEMDSLVFLDLLVKLSLDPRETRVTKATSDPRDPEDFRVPLVRVVCLALLVPKAIAVSAAHVVRLETQALLVHLAKRETAVFPESLALVVPLVIVDHWVLKALKVTLVSVD